MVQKAQMERQLELLAASKNGVASWIDPKLSEHKAKHVKDGMHILDQTPPIPMAPTRKPQAAGPHSLLHSHRSCDRRVLRSVPSTDLASSL